jgi:hypothetical protein
MTKLTGTFFFLIANALRRYPAEMGNFCASKALSLVLPLKVFQFISN